MFKEMSKGGNQNATTELSSTVNLTAAKMKSGSKGFTLAEILITLTVIGVVAALTIPTLLQNTNQAELKTALKRDFADLSQATLLIKNDAGGTLVNAFRNGAGDALDSENFKNAYKGKLNYIKECRGSAANGGVTGGGATPEGCWHAANTSHFLDGSLVTDAKVEPGLILSNGTLVLFEVFKSDFSLPTGDYKRGAYIFFDVNGFKSPNVFGKDIFTVNVSDDGLIPFGARGYTEPSDPVNGCVSGAAGYGCTAKYLYE